MFLFMNVPFVIVGEYSLWLSQTLLLVIYHYAMGGVGGYGAVERVG